MPNTDKGRAARKYAYAVGLATGPVLIFYGLISAEEFAIWAGFGATVLGVANSAPALANLTPKTRTPQDGPDAELLPESALLDATAVDDLPDNEDGPDDTEYYGEFEEVEGPTTGAESAFLTAPDHGRR
ncbi:hypothetical protein GCM10009847_15400 [Leucobacter tardus]|uniref:Holin n=1 Tax=Leucobacter tardus TaxID=501483 RepID=A0A939QDD1_9MICO|nr:hypothetical protein [Leucobacter tardus]MBO2989722.1 hypothetical protein [Leucobacter tardus]